MPRRKKVVQTEEPKQLDPTPFIQVVTNEFNCLACGGEGLKTPFLLCETCKGTGKV